MDRPFEIMLIEDNVMDLRLTREALRELGLNYNLQLAYDGEQALTMLRALKTATGQARPDLVLLDLNLPLCDGREVLTVIKNDPELASIPVLVLSTSRAGNDVVDCYRLHANSYMVKPLHFGDFVNLMRSTCDYWLSKATLPTRCASLKG